MANSWRDLKKGYSSLKAHDLSRGFSTGAGVGAMTAMVASGPIGWAVGIGAGLASLLGQDEEDVRGNRKRELLKQIGLSKERALAKFADLRKEGTTNIQTSTSNRLSAERQGASRRALSLGRSSDAESFIAPAEQRTLTAGSESLKDYNLSMNQAEQGLNQQYEQAIMGAESDFAGRPIEPSISDTLLEVGGLAVKAKQNQQYLDMMKEYYGVGDKAPSATPSQTTQLTATPPQPTGRITVKGTPSNIVTSPVKPPTYTLPLDQPLGDSPFYSGDVSMNRTGYEIGTDTNAKYLDNPPENYMDMMKEVSLSAPLESRTYNIPMSIEKQLSLQRPSYGNPRFSYPRKSKKPTIHWMSR